MPLPLKVIILYLFPPVLLDRHPNFSIYTNAYWFTSKNLYNGGVKWLDNDAEGKGLW